MAFVLTPAEDSHIGVNSKQHNPLLYYIPLRILSHISASPELLIDLCPQGDTVFYDDK